MTQTSPAAFLADLLANVGRGTVEAPPEPEPVLEPAPPAEIVHMMGFTSTDEIHVGGTATVVLNEGGRGDRYITGVVTKVNRASVLVEGFTARVLLGRVVIFRPAA